VLIRTLLRDPRSASHSPMTVSERPRSPGIQSE